MKTSLSQRRASQKWQKKNKKKQQIYNLRSNTKRFISEFANNDDLKEIEELVQKRLKKIDSALADCQNSKNRWK